MVDFQYTAKFPFYIKEFFKSIKDPKISGVISYFWGFLRFISISSIFWQVLTDLIITPNDYLEICEHVISDETFGSIQSNDHCVFLFLDNSFPIIFQRVYIASKSDQILGVRRQIDCEWEFFCIFRGSRKINPIVSKILGACSNEVKCLSIVCLKKIL